MAEPGEPTMGLKTGVGTPLRNLPDLEVDSGIKRGKEDLSQYFAAREQIYAIQYRNRFQVIRTEYSR